MSHYQPDSALAFGVEKLDRGYQSCQPHFQLWIHLGALCLLGGGGADNNDIRDTCNLATE